MITSLDIVPQVLFINILLTYILYLMQYSMLYTRFAYLNFHSKYIYKRA